MEVFFFQFQARRERWTTVNIKRTEMTMITVPKQIERKTNHYTRVRAHNCSGGRFMLENAEKKKRRRDVELFSRRRNYRKHIIRIAPVRHSSEKGDYLRFQKPALSSVSGVFFSLRTAIFVVRLFRSTGKTVKIFTFFFLSLPACPLHAVRPRWTRRETAARTRFGVTLGKRIINAHAQCRGASPAVAECMSTPHYGTRRWSCSRHTKRRILYPIINVLPSWRFNSEVTVRLDARLFVRGLLPSYRLEKVEKKKIDWEEKQRDKIRAKRPRAVVKHFCRCRRFRDCEMKKGT